VTYYVLVPSATAIIKSNVSHQQDQVGTKSQLDETDKNDLQGAQKSGLGNVTITSATLSTSGNTTTFSVTLKNQGSGNATIFGLTLHGNFSSASFPAVVCSQSTSSTSSVKTTTSATTASASPSHGLQTTTHGQEGNPPGQSGVPHGQQGCGTSNGHPDHPDTIPFKVNGTTLVPLFGDGNGAGNASSSTVKPGQSVTLTFSGVIGLKTDHSQHGQTQVIGSISGTAYTIRLEGEGFQTAQVTAA